MDDSFEELEVELKSLPLRRPSDEIIRRIGHDLAGAPHAYQTATNLNSFKWFGWRTLSLVTGVAVVAGLGLIRMSHPSLPAAAEATAPAPLTATSTAAADHPAQYQPVAASNVLYDLKDEGPVTVEGAAPSRRVRYRYVDTYTWKSPHRNASLKWSVPRDEIRVVPASLN